MGSSTSFPAVIRDLDAAAAAVAAAWDRAGGLRAPGEDTVLINLTSSDWRTIALNCLLGRLTAQAVNGTPVAMIRSKGMLGAFARRMLPAFGIGRILDLDQVLAAKREAAAAVVAAEIPAFQADGDAFCERLSAWSVDGVRIGDLLYDHFLQSRARDAAERLEADMLHPLRVGVAHMAAAGQILSELRVAALTGFSAVGLEGVFTRRALSRGVPVLSADGGHPVRASWRRDPTDALYADGGPTAGALQAAVAAATAAANPDAAQPVRNAVGGRPTILALAQNFSGAPHAAPLLFADHRQWLEATLAVARNVAGVDWVVVPDPAQEENDNAFYGQPRHVAGRERIAAMIAGASHIRVAEPEESLATLASKAAAAVTAHRFDGLFLAGRGVPVLTAGDPLWAGLGFTIDPATRSEYLAGLAGLGDTAPLSASQAAAARAVENLFAVADKVASPLLPEFAAPGRFDDVEHPGLPAEIARRAGRYTPRRDPLFETAATIRGR
jgi:hypothetical protein